MRPRIPDEKRAAILQDIRGGELSARAIGRKHRVAQSTVSLIAQQNNADGAFDRTKTEAATRAKQTDNRSRRAQLASDLLDDAQRLRGRAWSKYAYYVGTKDGAERVELDLPPLSEARNAYAAIGIAVDKHTALEKVDVDDRDLPAVDAWLKAMLGEQ